MVGPFTTLLPYNRTPPGESTKKAGEQSILRPYAGPDEKRTVEVLVRVRSGPADNAA